MNLIETNLHGVLLTETVVHHDSRGWFTESFNLPDWIAGFEALALGAPGPFVQDNASGSRKGVLRGLHYQLAPHGQGKLVRVTRGSIFDVAVDVRKGSPQFGQWHGVLLTAENHRQLWIPEGFAHGFLALEPGTQVAYKTTARYAKLAERSVRWDDPAIGVAWPLMAVGGQVFVSDKDAVAPLLADAELPEYGNSESVAVARFPMR